MSYQNGVESKRDSMGTSTTGEKQLYSFMGRLILNIVCIRCWRCGTRAENKRGGVREKHLHSFNKIKFGIMPQMATSLHNAMKCSSAYFYFSNSCELTIQLAHSINCAPVIEQNSVMTNMKELVHATITVVTFYREQLAPVRHVELRFKSENISDTSVSFIHSSIFFH